MIRGTIRHHGLHWLATIGVEIVMLLTATCRAQSRSAAGQQLAQRLGARVSIAWQGQELATGLERLAEAQRVSLWVDRRVDPATPIELTVSDQPLSKVLSAIATPHEWAATPYSGVLYFGPKQTAEDLATLSALARQSIAKAPAESRSRWLKPEAWAIPRLSAPRELLKQFARSAGATVADQQQVPHDLWPERTLPPMSALDRAVLLLSGFDLTCRISADGRTLRVVPIERPVHVVGAYAVSRARQAAVDAALADMPAAKIERQGQGVTLSARVEDHERLQAAIRGQSPQPASRTSAPQRAGGRSTRRFTLKIENQPAGGVIDQLAQQLQLEVAWDAALQQNPAVGREANVSCDVREANLDELLTAVLSPAGLAFEREGLKVSIRRSK